MGGILVYQKSGQVLSESPELFRFMIFVSEPEQVISRLEREYYQMVMIHLEKGEESGLKVASLVRGIPGYHLTPILFLASDHRYEKTAFYEYHCYDYLVKPIRHDEIIRIIYPFLIQMYTEKKERWMQVKIHGNIKDILLNDIIYLESANRSVRIHTWTETVDIPYLPLKQCLEGYGGIFVQCHRCVLVNRNYVNRIDYRRKRIELPGCSVEIGRQYEPVLRQEFQEQTPAGQTAGQTAQVWSNGREVTADGKVEITNERDISDSSWKAVQQTL